MRLQDWLGEGAHVVDANAEVGDLVGQTDPEREELVQLVGQAETRPAVLSPSEELTSGVDCGLGVHSGHDAGDLDLGVELVAAEEGRGDETGGLGLFERRALAQDTEAPNEDVVIF